MSDTPDPPFDLKIDEPAAPRTPRRQWQVGLRTLFLLVVAFAVWMTYFANNRSIETLGSRIASQRPLARELDVADPSRIAVVKAEELWYDENAWEVYLPPGRYRLCLATRAIDQDGLAPVAQGVPIAAGRHRLGLERDEPDSGWRVVVTCDGAKLLAAEESRDWDEKSGSVGGGEYGQSVQLPADQPTVLFRRRFTKRVPNAIGFASSIPKGPTEGLMLWIEPVPGP